MNVHLRSSNLHKQHPFIRLHFRCVDGIIETRNEGFQREIIPANPNDLVINQRPSYHNGTNRWICLSSSFTSFVASSSTAAEIASDSSSTGTSNVLNISIISLYLLDFTHILYFIATSFCPWVRFEGREGERIILRARIFKYFCLKKWTINILESRKMLTLAITAEPIMDATAKRKRQQQTPIEHPTPFFFCKGTFIN